MGQFKNIMVRFARFATSSSSTTILDLIILSFLTGYLNVNYLYAAGTSFTISNSVNYIVNRNWGFKDSKRGVGSGYLIFISIGSLGLALTVLLMWVFVSMLGFYYLVARIIIAVIEGTLSFIAHLIFTFKISNELPIFGFNHDADYSNIKLKKLLNN